MSQQIKDGKNWLIYAFWSTVNGFLLRMHFRSIDVSNRESLPVDRPFILVSNHVARWDGLLIYWLINRPSNFMVHPNELRGFQGAVLQSMGAFPANARLDLLSHIKNQLRKCEGIVIFPEGNIFTDGVTHPFKTGTARFAVNLALADMEVPLVPTAIYYTADGKEARLAVGNPVLPAEYLLMHKGHQANTVNALTDRLHREVSHLRMSLGASKEAMHLLQIKHSKCSKERPARSC